MPAFSYTSLDLSGKEQKGVLEADSSRQVRQLLREKGLTPLLVEHATSTGKTSKSSLGRSRDLSIKVGELALITRQLATLIQSSMPLEEALNAVSKQSSSEKSGNSKLSTIVLSVRSKVLEGHSLAESMGDFPKAFPVLYRATVSAGEHAGHLDLVLNRLADYTENSYNSRQKAKLALLYPILLLIMSLAIVSGLMAFVVPDVVEVFVGQGRELPTLTRGLISLSDFVVNYGLFLILAIIVLVNVLRMSLKRANVRLQWDRRLLRLPLLGRFIRGSDTARYASTLSILMSSGVPLVDAMKIAAEVISNTWLQQFVAAAAKQVREGGSLHTSLDSSGYFPPMMIHMIASGEASGDLDKMLERVSESQQRELDTLIATLIGIFEPVMLLFMGITVLVIVLAILQPIFDMNQLI
ncbi:MAG: general secretion pathway protein F [Oceanicoccus sp.]|jgi:general secretion pathway protein F